MCGLILISIAIYFLELSVNLGRKLGDSDQTVRGK
jgi:hypothetical protein